MKSFNTRISGGKSTSGWFHFSRFAMLIVLASGLFAGRITGFITDASSGEVLIGANVFIEDTNLGTATDLNGYYVINNIPVGDQSLIVSYLGYAPFSQSVQIAESTLQLNVSLEPAAVQIQEVNVTGEKITRQFTIAPSRVSLSPRELKSLPSIVEPDLFRTIQAMPGVLTPSEFSTGLIIRGGNTDQNLILLDGITVYNPSHLGGVFSNFIIDAVKEADLIKGGFNVEYGGRLSAVLNIISREGNRKEFQAKTSVSLLAAQTTLEGPFYNGAWLVAGRRTYFDKVLKGTPYYIPYYFYDLQGHVFSDITSRDRVSLSFYQGLDDLIFDDLGLSANWGNNTYSLAYRKLISDRLIGNFLAASSNFTTSFNLGGASGIVSENVIDDKTVSANFSFFQSQTINWKFGMQSKALNFTYHDQFNDSTLFAIRESPWETAVYTKLKWVPMVQLVIEPGLRMNYYSNHSRNWYPDTRLGVKWILTTDRFLNFAVGNYHQFIETVQDDYNPTILDSWFAVDSSVEPASAIQYVFGYEEYVGVRWRYQVEGYYKTINNMLTFEDTRATTDGTMSDEKLSDMFIPSDGYAYGLETFIQKTDGPLTGWLAYTWSVSRKYFKDKEYFTNWDRRHALNLIGSWRFRPRWELNGRWAWQSGQAFTPILGYYREDLPGDPTPRFRTIPGSRNSGRYPAFHRLDISLIRRFTFRNFTMELSAQVINAYNRKNIFRYIYNVGSTTNGLDDDGDWVKASDDLNENGFPDPGEPHVDEEDEGIIRREDISIFPLIPSLGIMVEL